MLILELQDFKTGPQGNHLMTDEPIGTAKFPGPGHYRLEQEFDALRIVGCQGDDPVRLKISSPDGYHLELAVTPDLLRNAHQLIGVYLEAMRHKDTH